MTRFSNKKQNILKRIFSRDSTQKEIATELLRANSLKQIELEIKLAELSLKQTGRECLPDKDHDWFQGRLEDI